MFSTTQFKTKQSVKLDLVVAVFEVVVAVTVSAVARICCCCGGFLAVSARSTVLALSPWDHARLIEVSEIPVG